MICANSGARPLSPVEPLLTINLKTFHMARQILYVLKMLAHYKTAPLIQIAGSFTQYFG
jgi:hypothetical protein